jgi:putative peptide zinc metalloprotease protein
MILEDKNDPKNIWLQVERAIDSRESKVGFNIWSIANEQNNLLKYRPKRKDSFELAEIDGKDGAKSYMLRNTVNDKYLILGEKDLFLWNLMDGNKSSKDLYIELSMEYGLVSENTIFSFIHILKDSGFLQDKSTSVYQNINDRLRKHKLLYQVKKVIDFLLHARMTTKKADIFFAWIYSGLSVVFKKTVLVLMFGMLAINLGLTAFFVFYKHETMLLSPGTGAGSHDVIVMMVVTYLSVLVHEIAHGLTVKHYKRKVLRAGLMLLFGSPIAYVDTTDILMKGRFPRIGVSFAGPCVNGVIGGILLLLALVFPESIYENIALHAGLINSLLFVVNLIPFSETDGHYIIQDWLEQPQLRKESLKFLRLGIWKILVGKEKWQKKDFGYLFYSSISVVGIVYLVTKGVHLWIFTGRHLLEEALTNSRMVLEVLLFWIILVLVIAFFRTIVRLKDRKTSITHLLEAHLKD